MAKEHLTYSDYTYHKRKRSQIIPGQTVMAGEWMRCPLCRFSREPLQSGRAVNCEVCNLRLCLSGDRLEISDEDGLRKEVFRE